MCVCLSVFLLFSVCLSVCLCVGTSLKNRKFLKRNYGKIISNVSDFISPIRLLNTEDYLAGEVARVSGWGRTSDSKYNFLIILYFNLNNCTYQIDWFKGEETHGLQKTLWPLWKIFYLFCVMQNARAVHGCMAVLYQPANWCYVYIKNIILWIKFL